MISIIIILFIGLCAFIGYKKGLIKVAINLVSFIIAIIITLAIYKPVANFVVKKTEMDENIQNAIIEKILPKGISADDKVEINSNIPKTIISGTENTVNEISNSITLKIIELGALLIIFIVIKIVLKFVSALADLIAKLPILKQFNKAGGLIYGILNGCIWVFVIFAIISLLSPLISPNYIELINKSFLGSLFYNSNILLDIIM